MAERAKGTTVWDIATYVFPARRRSNPLAHRFLVLRDRHAEEIEEPSDAQIEFLLEASEQFGLNRATPRLNEEDFHDVRAILGALTDLKDKDKEKKKGRG